jgi:hypothetical protein
LFVELPAAARKGESADTIGADDRAALREAASG